MSLRYAVAACQTDFPCPRDRSEITSRVERMLEMIDASFHEITRFAISESDAVTAESRHLAEATRTSFGIDKEVQVVPGFIDSEVFKPELRDATLRRPRPSCRYHSRRTHRR